MYLSVGLFFYVLVLFHNVNFCFNSRASYAHRESVERVLCETFNGVLHAKGGGGPEII